MSQGNAERIFTPDTLEDLFPADRADVFFENLLGDAAEGAYDIRLVFAGEGPDRLDFAFHLTQRPGRCLACNLTHGLPGVFSRHPVIDVNGLVRRIDELLDDGHRCGDWRLGSTREVSRELHVIPLTISLAVA